MIWLWSNLWWLGPLLVIGAGLAHPVPRKLLEQVPARWWIRLGVLALFGLTFQCGRWYERSVAKERQEATEKRLDAKAAQVAKASHEAAQKAREGIRKESDDVQVRIREVVRTVPGGCPAMPDELHDLLQREVERARAELSGAAGPGNP